MILKRASLGILRQLYLNGPTPRKTLLDNVKPPGMGKNWGSSKFGIDCYVESHRRASLVVKGLIVEITGRRTNKVFAITSAGIAALRENSPDDVAFMNA